MQSVKQVGSSIRRETDDWAVWSAAIEKASLPRQQEAALVTAHLLRLNVSYGPFHRPLKFGDAEQIAMMNRMQRELAFCDKCLKVPCREGGEEYRRSHQVSRVGTRCKCDGLFVPGAALEPYWRAQQESGQ